MSDLQVTNRAEPQERNRILRAGLATSILNRSVAAAVPLVSIPLALGELGKVNYGAWATALSLTTMVAFADLGIGTGLMTRLAGFSTARGTNDSRVVVSSAYAVVVMVVLVGLAALTTLAYSVNIGGLLGASSSSGTIELIVTLTIAAFVINVLVSLIVRVQYGLGLQARANLFQAAGSIAMLLGMWLAVRFAAGAATFVAVAAFTPVTIGLFNTFHFFWVDEIGREIRPSPRMISLWHAYSLMRLGVKFVAVGVMMAAATGLDPWIVGRTASLGQVANYAVPYRIFALIGSVSVMASMPLWPLHAQAVRSGDVDWIRRTTKRITVWATAAVAGACVGAVACSNLVIPVWLGGDITVDLWLWTGMAAWWVAQTMTGPMFMVQNGAEVIGPQLLGYSAYLVAIPVKWWVSIHFGYVWIPWVSAGAYATFVGSSCLVGYRRALSVARDNGHGVSL